MELLLQYADDVIWKDIIFSGLRIALILVVVWVALLVVRSLLRRLETTLVKKGQEQGEVPTAAAKRAATLVRLLRQGFVFLILEIQVRVGDVAIINGTGGLVERVNFRTIVLRDNAGTVHVFPNGSITTLSNMTREWSAYVFNIGVAYKEDIDRVIALLKQIGQELRNDAKFGALMQSDIEVFGIDK